MSVKCSLLFFRANDPMTCCHYPTSLIHFSLPFFCVFNQCLFLVYSLCLFIYLVEQLIRSWSPLIWLHSEERFLPSTVEFFLPEVTIQDEQSIVVQNYVTPETLIGGENSSVLHMQTREPLGWTFN